MSEHAKTEVLVSEIPFLDYLHAKNLRYWLIGQRILQSDWMKVHSGPYFKTVRIELTKKHFYFL